MNNLKQHPLSAAFPALDETAFRALKADIELNGVRERIVTDEEMILDGWHRYRACQELNIVPPINAFEGEDPIAYVISKNLHRRHLDPSQRSLAWVRLTAWQEKAGRKSRSLEKAKEFCNFAELSIDATAKLAQVGTRTISHARAATKALPEVQDAVMRGELSVSQAAELALLSPESQKAALTAPRAKHSKKANVDNRH
jgi:ParB-like chromosome segregation protein Spo0J